MGSGSPERVHLSVAEARALSERAIAGRGSDPQEPLLLADHVPDAALCGYESSGLPKLLNVAEHPRFKAPRRPMRALKETSVSVLFDGGNQSGMLGMYYATRAVIERAQAHGFALVGVIPFVGAQRDPAHARNGGRHGERRLPLGVARRGRQARVHRQAVTVLHQDVALVAELGLVRLALAGQSRLGVGRRGMGGVAALLAMGIHRRIARVVGRPSGSSPRATPSRTCGTGATCGRRRSARPSS